MKILQINKLYHPVLGGVERIVQDIAENLNQGDLEVSVLACQKKGKRQEGKINGVTVYKAASLGKIWGMPISFDFFRLFKKIINDYDLIIIHHPFPLAFVALPFLPRKKLFIIYHSDIVRQKLSVLPFLPFINYGLKRAEKVFVSGENIVKHSKVLQSHKEKCVINPFGIDMDEYKATPAFLEEAKLIKESYGKPLLLSVGRLVYYKGFQYLISAMQTIQANLIIIGQGPEKKKLEGLIKRLALTHRVSIIDHVPNLNPYCLAADIFILPSCASSEAFGLVQLEAMAYGKPIVNTYLQTAVEEVSLNNVTGITVPPGQTLALVKAINSLLSNPEKREEYGQAAKLRAQTNFKSKDFFTKLILTLKS